MPTATTVPIVSASLPELIALAYEGARDVKGMERFIASAAHYFSADEAALVVWPLKDPDMTLPILHGMDQARFQSLHQQRHEPDSVFARLVDAPMQESFSRGINGHAPASLPNDLHDWHVLAGIVHSTEETRSAVIFLRSPAHSDFSDSERETLQVVMGYLARAIDVSRDLVNLYLELQAARSIVNGATKGVVVLNRRSESTYMNWEAERILKRTDGVAIKEGAFHIEDKVARKEFAAFMSSCTAGSGGDVETLRNAIPVPRNDSDKPLELLVFSLPHRNYRMPIDDARPIAFIVMTDPGGPVQAPEDLLVAMWHLTPAEVDLAQSLFEGASLNESADALGISINTVRTQLRSIFRKTGVNSQADLQKRIALSLRVSPF